MTIAYLNYDENTLESHPMQKPAKEFINKEAIGGLVLIGATILALIINNVGFSTFYDHFLNLRFSVQLGNYGLSKPALLWINDGLMSVFFFVIGLELKREFLTGHLRDIRQVILPATAAIGGVVVPVIFYLVLTHGHSDYAKGWAIPMATDIAFALGIMSLFSSRISREMKLFLLTLAIIDDLMAIVVIAIFHSHSLSWYSLMIAGICIVTLIILNLIKVKHFVPYLVVGLILWTCVLKSGVHATLAGVIFAFFIPMQGRNNKPLVSTLEHDLHPFVAYIILPLFAFANAGINFSNFTLHSFTNAIPLGIVLGLVLGKPIGITLFTFITQKLTKAKMAISWLDVLIIGFFAGIGFTMSLFIASLSFGNNIYWLDLSRLGILSASVIAALTASLLTIFYKKKLQ